MSVQIRARAWRRIRISVTTLVRECPQCGVPIASSRGMELHLSWHWDMEEAAMAATAAAELEPDPEPVSELERARPPQAPPGPSRLDRIAAAFADAWLAVFPRREPPAMPPPTIRQPPPPAARSSGHSRGVNDDGTARVSAGWRPGADAGRAGAGAARGHRAVDRLVNDGLPAEPGQLAMPDVRAPMAQLPGLHGRVAPDLLAGWAHGTTIPEGISGPGTFRSVPAR